jgi:hypothetical protein
MKDQKVAAKKPWSDEKKELYKLEVEATVRDTNKYDNPAPSNNAIISQQNQLIQDHERTIKKMGTRNIELNKELKEYERVKAAWNRTPRWLKFVYWRINDVINIFFRFKK